MNKLVTNRHGTAGNGGGEFRHLRIVQIVGMLRSGSTALGAWLGSSSNSVCVGESNTLWRALADDHWCACGYAASKCPFWSQVSLHLLPHLQAAGLSSYDAVADLADRAVRFRLLPLYFCGLLPQYSRRYGDALRGLYSVVASVTPALQIVDIAKNPSNAFICSRAGLNTFVVQAIRSPLSVAASEASAYSTDSRAALPPVRSPFKSAIFWSLYTTASFLSARRLQKVHIAVRQEDFASDVNSTAAQLATAQLLIPQDATVDFGHILTGNPARVRSRTKPPRGLSRREARLVRFATPTRRIWGY